MAKISKLYAREILDSRATPTIEVVCVLEDGSVGVSSVPSDGARELRDGDQNWYMGHGVQKAVVNVNQTIASTLIGQNLESVAGLDHLLLTLDPSLGSNAILAVSIAFTKSMASSARLSLYKYIAQIF